MLRISKLTDYGVVLLAQIARDPCAGPQNARELAARTHLPFPGLGHVARSGDAYAWVPEEWQYM